MPRLMCTSRDEESAKIAIDHPQAVLDVKGMSKPDIARAQNVVREQRARFLAIWIRYHG